MAGRKPFALGPKRYRAQFGVLFQSGDYRHQKVLFEPVGNRLGRECRLLCRSPLRQPLRAAHPGRVALHLGGSEDGGVV